MSSLDDQLAKRNALLREIAACAVRAEAKLDARAPGPEVEHSVRMLRALRGPWVAGWIQNQAWRAELDAVRVTAAEEGYRQGYLARAAEERPGLLRAAR